jgi:YggT family protein
MVFFANAGIWLLSALILLLRIYSYTFIAAALISWVFLPPTNPVVRFLRFITEPVLSPCRALLFRILPRSWHRIDFSPVLAYALIWLLIYLISALARGL